MDIELSIEAKETGEISVKRLPVEGRIALGRGPENPVMVEGIGVSREHLIFEPSSDGVLLTDLSANGTWLNSQRLKTGVSTEVTEADRIEIPGYTVRFVLTGLPAKKTPVVSALPAEEAAVRPVSKLALPALTQLEWLTGIAVIAAVTLVLIFLKL